MVSEFGGLLFCWACCPRCHRHALIVRWWLGREWCDHSLPNDRVPAFARVRLDPNKRAHLPRVSIR